jgi:hypothetical protein
MFYAGGHRIAMNQKKQGRKKGREQPAGSGYNLVIVPGGAIVPTLIVIGAMPVTPH